MYVFLCFHEKWTLLNINKLIPISYIFETEFSERKVGLDPGEISICVYMASRIYSYILINAKSRISDAVA